MKFVKNILCAAAVTVCTTLPAAAADRVKLMAFMQVTGFDVALASLRTSAKDAPAMLGLNAADFGQSWTILADDLFDADDLHADALDILEKAMKEDVLDHAAEFYASDLGQRLVSVENESHFADDGVKRAEGQNAAAELMARNSPQIGYFKDMSDAIGSIDSSIKQFREVQVRFLLAAMASGLIENSLSEAGLRELLSVQDDEVQTAVLENMIVANAYTYRAFSDDEMRQYRDALRTPEMVEVYELMNAVQYTLMADRYEQMAQRMIELHPSQAL